MELTVKPQAGMDILEELDTIFRINLSDLASIVVELCMHKLTEVRIVVWLLQRIPGD